MLGSAIDAVADDNGIRKAISQLVQNQFRLEIQRLSRRLGRPSMLIRRRWTTIASSEIICQFGHEHNLLKDGVQWRRHDAGYVIAESIRAAT